MDNIVLDETLLSGYLDSLGADIVDQMIDLYEQQSAIYLTDINNALNVNTQSLWQDSCHKMKGAAGSVGLRDVHSFLVSIEKSTVTVTEKQAFLLQLAELNARGISAFKVWQKSF